MLAVHWRMLLIELVACFLFPNTLLNFFVAHFVVTLVSAIVRKLAYIA